MKLARSRSEMSSGFPRGLLTKKKKSFTLKVYVKRVAVSARQRINTERKLEQVPSSIQDL